MDFLWDPEKAAANLKKHGVAFEDAAFVFSDPSVLTIFDPEHSEDEDRFISIGMDLKTRVLVVVHVSKLEKSPYYYRIISARKANRIEQAHYAKGKV
jgi:uncharacterized DUF497 family protein